MEVVYQSKYSKHEYDSKSGTMFTDWFAETVNMSNADFKKEMQEWLAAFRMKSPKYLFDNCIGFKYPIVPKEQIWMAQLLNAEWIALGLKKYAHMVPAELITELSVEQLFEEFFSMKLENQFQIVNFASKEEALNWLRE